MDKYKKLSHLPLEELRELANDLEIRSPYTKNKRAIIFSIMEKKIDVTPYLYGNIKRTKSQIVFKKAKIVLKKILPSFFFFLALFSLIQLLTVKPTTVRKSKLIKELHDLTDESTVLKSKLKNAESKLEIIKSNLISKGNKLEPVIYFDFNSYKIKPNQEIKLHALTPFLDDEDEMVFLGYTDEIGQEITNEKLSIKRAIAVQNFYKENKPFLSNTQIVGFGKNRPSGNQDTENGRSKNRKVEIKVKSKSVEKQEEDDDFLPFIYSKLEDLRNAINNIDLNIDDINHELEIHTENDESWYNNKYLLIFGLLIGIIGSISSIKSAWWN
jgi:outer membrane protein OmpA-like peptidoglycan-associated protein